MKKLSLAFCLVLGLASICWARSQDGSPLAAESLPIFPNNVISISPAVIYLGERVSFDFETAEISVKGALSALKDSQDPTQKEYLLRIVGYSIIAISQLGAATPEAEQLLNIIEVQIGKDLVPPGIMLPDQYFAPIMGVAFKAASGSVPYSLSTEQTFTTFISMARQDLQKKAKSE